MNAHDQFADLWTDYLEGELDEAGLAKLRELLDSDETLLKLAADLYQSHRLLGMVAEEAPKREDEFVREVLARLPKESDGFVGSVMGNVERISISSPNRSRGRRRYVALYGGVYSAVALLVLAVFAFWPLGRSSTTTVGVQPSDGSSSNSVRFASLARAKFFSELPPPVNSAPTLKRDYVLMSGLAEITFPSGASAIVEGPAVFRVLSEESLALNVGRCSVHAPTGAEGFRVVTPETHVVDRGTRFAVSVGETSETEVQVIEGAADIYDRTNSDPRSGVRLTKGEARKFVKRRGFATADVPFDPNGYRSELPDRVVSYETTASSDGRAEILVGVTVQRGGRVLEVPAEELISARVTAFKATTGNLFLCGGETISGKRIDALSDRSLITGVLNPGGNTEPLATSPVTSGGSATPGMAVQFDKPVVNGPGADVVFFEIQTYSNPPDGDAFHVSPMLFRDGLKSHTIRSFDLTLESPNVRNLTDIYAYFFVNAATSLEKLESLDCSPQKQGIQFKGLAVGIDLSDLGYAPGEKVDGLFFQDALDDKHYVDPVLIAGLPTVD